MCILLMNNRGSTELWHASWTELLTLTGSEGEAQDSVWWARGGSVWCCPPSSGAQTAPWFLVLLKRTETGTFSISNSHVKHRGSGEKRKNKGKREIRRWGCFSELISPAVGLGWGYVPLAGQVRSSPSRNSSSLGRFGTTEHSNFTLSAGSKR